MITFFYFKFFPLFVEFPDTNNLIFININEFSLKDINRNVNFQTFGPLSKCHISNQEKFLKRNDSRTPVIFQALKMKCSLVICRIAINKKCHSFKLLDYLSLCPIGFHEQDWLLAMTLQKRHFCKTDIDCSMLVEEHQHL